MIFVEIPLRTLQDEIEVIEHLLSDGKISEDFASGAISALKWVGMGTPAKEGEAIN